MADESSEGRRYSYRLPPTKKKKADEDSEGKRYSYKRPPANSKKGEVRPKRKTTPEEARRAERKKRQATGDLFDKANITKPTPKEKAFTKDVKRRIDTASREKKRDRIYEGLPRPVVKRDRPEGGPTPMIQPQVGPIGDLRSKAAHTYGFTPEAYESLRKVPIRSDYPSGPDKVKEFEGSVGGYYDEKGPEIYLNPTWGTSGDWPAGVLAHEQAHSQFHDRGYDQANRYDSRGIPTDLEEGPSPYYQKDFNRWAGETLPNGQPVENSGRLADEDFQDDKSRSQNYATWPDIWPTERYARTVELSPNDNRSDWPDEVRPYYRGFLQGMDKLSTGEPTPDNTNYVAPWKPDANGVFGTPPYRRNW